MTHPAGWWRPSRPSASQQNVLIQPAIWDAGRSPQTLLSGGSSGDIKKKKLYVATEDIKADIKASEVRKSSPAHVVQKDLQMGHECHKPSPSCPPVHEKHDGKWN